MKKDKQEAGIGLPEIGVSLDELVRRGARQVIEQVIELELAALLEQRGGPTCLDRNRWVLSGTLLMMGFAHFPMPPFAWWAGA